MRVISAFNTIFSRSCRAENTINHSTHLGDHPVLTHDKHRRLYEYVEEEIGVTIVEGTYQPGDSLPNEDSLCRTYDVSRGVIREAVKVLTTKGLVRPKPKIGTQVQPRSRWNLFDANVLQWMLRAGHQLDFLKKVTEVRSIIESEAAKLAAQKATEAETANILDLAARLNALLEQEADYSYESYLELDMRFHLAILDASHNEILASLGHTMRQAVHTARQADTHDLEKQLDSMPHHHAVANAIAEHDPDAAYRASAEMLDLVWRTID